MTVNIFGSFFPFFVLILAYSLLTSFRILLVEKLQEAKWSERFDRLGREWFVGFVVMALFCAYISPMFYFMNIKLPSPAAPLCLIYLIIFQLGYTISSLMRSRMKPVPD